jgi:hypothetical protein
VMESATSGASRERASKIEPVVEIGGDYEGELFQFYVQVGSE